MDSQGRLFVGDRQNNRIQIFDQDGKFLDQWAQFGRPSGILIDGNDNIYVADSSRNSCPRTTMAGSGKSASAAPRTVGDGVHSRSRGKDHRHERGRGRRGGRDGQHLRRRGRPEADDEIRAEVTRRRARFQRVTRCRLIPPIRHACLHPGVPRRHHRGGPLGVLLRAGRQLRRPRRAGARGRLRLLVDGAVYGADLGRAGAGHPGLDADDGLALGGGAGGDAVERPLPADGGGDPAGDATSGRSPARSPCRCI